MIYIHSRIIACTTNWKSLNRQFQPYNILQMVSNDLHVFWNVTNCTGNRWQSYPVYYTRRDSYLSFSLCVFLEEMSAGCLYLVPIRYSTYVRFMLLLGKSFLAQKSKHSAIFYDLGLFLALLSNHRVIKLSINRKDLHVICCPK